MVGKTAPLIQAIYTLGTLRIVGDAGQIPLRSEDARRLLVCLIVARSSPLQRAHLIDQLWPDHAPDAGRRRLRDALYRLRHALGAAAIQVEANAIRLQADLVIDYWAFCDKIAGRASADLQAAVDLYRGELAPEIVDEWIVPSRAAAREQLLRALEQLADQIADPLPLLRRLTAEEPLHEPACRRLIECLARAGRPVDALAEYERLEQTLAAELGIIPEEATRRLAERLRAELERSRRHEQQRYLHPPFVGRIHERSLLLARLETARAGRGGLILLLGAAGVGKTRLAEELAAGAQWRGWHVAWGRAEEIDRPPPL
ncbi:MAG: AAA family ATPase, partial [Oscillochloris sp.]|nr:AAA family ATPase [Oscillochloris sp.]